MEQNIKKWLWQHKNYPTFPYDKIALQEIIAKKYMAITKTSRATAVRDIGELVFYGCIAQIEGSSGRNVRYEIEV